MGFGVPTALINLHPVSGSIEDGFELCRLEIILLSLYYVYITCIYIVFPADFMVHVQCHVFPADFMVSGEHVCTCILTCLYSTLAIYSTIANTR